MLFYSTLFLIIVAMFCGCVAGEAQALPDTQLLVDQGDLASAMVSGIDGFLMQELKDSVGKRAAHWNRDFTSPQNYAASIEPQRQRFRKIIGVVDPREAPEMRLDESLAPTGIPESTAGPGYQVYRVHWSVLKGVDAAGLLLLPEGEPAADIVALPDCDWTPQMLAGLEPGAPEEAQFARRLAENGCRVLIPILVNRSDTWSGLPGVRMTNQPHREFIYRAAFELGRHIIGFETQEILAAVDWLTMQKKRPIGVIGYGEGGLLAFYAAASDTRIDAAAVCGYFGPREGIWREPIYRNVFGLLEEFGDAEITGLIAPRSLVIQACRQPEIPWPPAPTPERSGAAPGVITTPPLAEVEAEFQRAQQWMAPLQPPMFLRLVKEGEPGNGETLAALLETLGKRGPLSPPGKAIGSLTPNSGGTKTGPLTPDPGGTKTPSLIPDPAEKIPHPLTTGSRETNHPLLTADPADSRQKRQFTQLLEYTQALMREAPLRRAEFWSEAGASSVERWRETCRPYRDYLWNEVIGRLPAPTMPTNPRTRLIYDTPRFKGYEVMLDVYPGVFASGILLLPYDLKPGERRPVVVCQHGLEGRPRDVADPEVDDPTYHQFACKLAEQGFITYAPQNPYIGGDRFRVLQRKANPLKLSLFSFIVRQHERTLEWLKTLPQVDPNRIAFYGLSYGGKTAMRVPALLEQYYLSICSGDYNEWIWKNASSESPYSYLLTGEYEMPEFDLGNTFNYAELSWLICPRPFMVERGHQDGVAPDEWVAYEYALTRRRYDLLGLSAQTEMEVFDGPHTIHGVGTFAFLHRMLGYQRGNG